MVDILVYYAHPGHQHSQVNRAMMLEAQQLDNISFIDLYGLYPRHDIDVDTEQQRVQAHDIILFQFPLFWYSTPSLIKEWQDLVLEHGFAYGADGDKLAGKIMMLAITAAGPENAYSPQGYQQFDLRTFLTPLEQTANLCQMQFAVPYVLFASLRARSEDLVEPHVTGYKRLLTAMRDGTYDFESAARHPYIGFDNLPIRSGAAS